MTLFTDYVQGPSATTAAVANAVALDSLTLPASARMITRIWVNVAGQGTFAASKPFLGYLIVESEDANLEPLNIPIEPIGGYLTLGGGGQPSQVTKWIINAPVPGGAVIDFSTVTDVAPNAAAEVIVTIEFSDGGSPFPGGQVHMKIGEPAVACSTSDNGETSNSNIEIKASQIHLLVAYVAFTTSVADCSAHANLEVTSDDFAQSGPWKLGLEPDHGGDANMISSDPKLTKIEADRRFKIPGQKQTVKAKVIMRDAVSTAPLSNWLLVYS